MIYHPHDLTSVRGSSELPRYAIMSIETLLHFGIVSTDTDLTQSPLECSVPRLEKESRGIGFSTRFVFRPRKYERRIGLWIDSTAENQSKCCKAFYQTV